MCTTFSNEPTNVLFYRVMLLHIKLSGVTWKSDKNRNLQLLKIMFLLLSAEAKKRFQARNHFPIWFTPYPTTPPSRPPPAQPPGPTLSRCLPQISRQFQTFPGSPAGAVIWEAVHPIAAFPGKVHRHYVTDNTARRQISTEEGDRVSATASGPIF